LPRYSLTVEADSLAELTGALTSAASMLQAGDASDALATELAPLAAPQAQQALEQPPLPLPPPDYAATGLTDWQAMQVRQAQSQPAAQAPAGLPFHTLGELMAPPPAPQAPAPVAVATSPATPNGVPHCPIHQREMTWKGGVINPKTGRQQPLWSCPDTACRQAIWPPR
jgi:hypothetical protein